MSFYDRRGWKPYVPVAERRRQAEHELQKLAKKGHPISPVLLEGRTIARTFWGKAWCENLERYSDFANRLPRGRTYVRNGSVVDLQLAPGAASAIVSGSALYKVAVNVLPLPKPRWRSLCTDCAGGIDSLVELLQGRFSKGVMERLCQPATGLFPAPAELTFTCSCPDWASMCKHVAATFYGIGARLDEKPELLFTLRQVDQQDLLASAGKGLPLSKKGPAKEKVLVADDLSELFGLELGAVEDDAQESKAKTKTKTKARARPKPKATQAKAKPRAKAKPGARASKRKPSRR
ncbi:MAG: hypothetical protein IT371_05690 [Deltaproteobacteria bacterium]|nr:hypothetical protein [Deltaproteobacteria bacterium]